ncbi:S1 family peptidase [Vibrio sinaloensis]|uniref:S1 family peptidase n=1 Tax=Photobacterium sp. (strain ATCC 43367) TaxID=379097 RepID=UPI0035EBF71B
MFKSIGAASALLVSFSIHSFEVEPYIVNGSTVNIANYPSFASLFYRSDTLYSTNSFCGATMINSEYALTAAHCIYGQDETMLYTVVAPQLEDEAQFLSSTQARVVEFYYPDTYSDSSSTLWRDDIAILKLESPLPVGDMRSLLNTTYNNAYPSNADFKAVGHGFIEGNVPGGTELLQTDLDYISTSDCRTEIGSQITTKQLCFGGDEVNGYQNSTCSGDSGGPVYFYNGIEYIQVGLTSFGPATCGDVRYNVTSVFTDIYDYQTWINQVLNGQVEPQAYVALQDGIRVLVNRDSGTTQAEVVSESSQSRSGGSLSLFMLISLILLTAKSLKKRTMSNQ